MFVLAAIIGGKHEESNRRRTEEIANCIESYTGESTFHQYDWVELETESSASLAQRFKINENIFKDCYKRWGQEE